MDHIQQINFLYFEGNRTLNSELHAFLQSGNKPIVINFGSAEHAIKDFHGLAKSTIERVTTMGYRAMVLCTMKFEEYTADKNVIFVDYAAHTALLQHAITIIHHGGIGTVYAALRSGIPQIIVPQILDQHFWAEIISKRNLGRAVYSEDKRYSSTLNEAITQILNDKVLLNNVEEVKIQLKSSEYRDKNLNRIQEAIPECFTNLE